MIGKPPDDSAPGSGAPPRPIRPGTAARGKPERSGGLRPVAALVPALSRQAIGRKALHLANLLEYWADVVGAEIACHTTPLRIRGGRDGQPATLELAVSASYAPIWQHAEPQLLARINDYFGGNPRIGRVALKQQSRPETRRHVRRNVGAAAARDLSENVAKIDDPELRNALERLGLAILAHQSGSGRRTD